MGVISTIKIIIINIFNDKKKRLSFTVKFVKRMGRHVKNNAKKKFKTNYTDTKA